MRCPRTHGVVFTCVAITPRSPGLNAAVKIRLSRQGLIESITVIGELDLSNVGVLDDAQCALRDHHELPARSLPGCIHGRVGGAYVLRWSKDAQLSAREGLAIMVGGQDTEATRVLSLIAAMRALEIGRKPQSERPLRWLTDLELAAERDAAQTSSDAATRRLGDAIAEQDTRRRETDEGTPPDA